MQSSQAPADVPIFLIGFMASGKTTVGRIVAAKLGLGWTFLDLDEIITDAAGRSVARIFADEGEAGFRQRESEALRAAAQLRRTVVATGGGAACREENLSLMLAAGHVVALSVTPAEVVRRAGARSGPAPAGRSRRSAWRGARVAGGPRGVLRPSTPPCRHVAQIARNCCRRGAFADRAPRANPEPSKGSIERPMTSRA